METIGVVEDVLPDKADLYQAASVGSSFGLIGALIDAGVDANREGRLLKLVEAEGYDAESVFYGAINAAVSARGYKLTGVSAEREGRAFLSFYPDPGAAEPVDAFLDVTVVDYGYLSAGVGATWRPYVYADVRLVRAGTSELLMENKILYNALGGGVKGAISMSPNPDFGFRDVKEMEADPARAMQGLSTALAEVAETIATLLQ